MSLSIQNNGRWKRGEEYTVSFTYRDYNFTFSCRVGALGGNTGIGLGRIVESLIFGTDIDDEIYRFLWHPFQIAQYEEYINSVDFVTALDNTIVSLTADDIGESDYLLTIIDITPSDEAWEDEDEVTITFKVSDDAPSINNINFFVGNLYSLGEIGA
jgi:hypothetical protein